MAHSLGILEKSFSALGQVGPTENRKPLRDLRGRTIFVQKQVPSIRLGYRFEQCRALRLREVGQSNTLDDPSPVSVQRVAFLLEHRLS